MAYYLAKTDPESYSIDQFAADKRTVWDGVTNPQAVAVIKTMQPGDRVFLYHSGSVPAIVGLAKVTRKPRPDSHNPKSWVVEMQFLRLLQPPTTLAGIKAEGSFNDWALIRQGRLSTMTVPPAFVDWLRARYPSAKL